MAISKDESAIIKGVDNAIIHRDAWRGLLSAVDDAGPQALVGDDGDDGRLTATSFVKDFFRFFSPQASSRQS